MPSERQIRVWRRLPNSTARDVEEKNIAGLHLHKQLSLQSLMSNKVSYGDIGEYLEI